MKNRLTIVIPVHEFNKKVETYLNSVINSINKQVLGDKTPKPDVVIVHDPSITKKLKFDNTVDARLLSNSSGDCSYQGQVNFASQNISTEYFSVVEYDDEIGTTYVKRVYNHINYMSDVEVFLPMIIEVDSENQAVKFTNEPVWSQQFVGDNGEIGYLSDELLNEYSDFKLSGAVFKNESFKNIGLYKTHIKLTFMFEFLLRAIKNGFKIYTIPKIIYKHLVGREGSMFEDYSKNMSIEERKFWFETAKAEHLFTKDRDVVYQPQSLSNPKTVVQK